MTKAEQACRELLQTYSQSLTILNVLGAVLAGQGQLLPAVQVFDKVIQLKPDYAEAYSNRGVALKKLGQLEETVESHQKSIGIQPDLHSTWGN